MNLYLISQSVNNGYDTYDSAVVAAENADDAKIIHPSSFKNNWDGRDEVWGSWCNADKVKVELIGVAEPRIERGVILASFNAG